jgi:hypothetical protein
MQMKVGLKGRVRLTTGFKANYADQTKGGTADIKVEKTLMNEIMSGPDANYDEVDIKEFYICKLNVLEYIKLKMKDSPTEIIAKYKLQEFTHNDALLLVIEIACGSSKATENTMKKGDRTLGQVAAYPNNLMKEYKSGIILFFQLYILHVILDQIQDQDMGVFIT